MNMNHTSFQKNLSFEDCFSEPYPIDYLYESATIDELNHKIERG